MLHYNLHVAHKHTSFLHVTNFQLITHKPLPCKCSPYLKPTVKLLLSMVTNHTPTSHADKNTTQVMHIHHEHTFKVMHIFTSTLDSMHNPMNTHASQILALTLKSSNQARFIHAYHACHQASHALNKPHYNLEPNLSNDDVFTMLLYLDDYLILYNDKPMTILTISPKGGKSYATTVKQVKMKIKLILDVYINSRPRVKMKRATFLFKFIIVFDPG